MNVLWDMSTAASREGSTRTYDVAGRLLTEQHSVNGQTSYGWDGFDCVREFAPGLTGTATFDSATFGSGGWDGVTNYYVVNGVLWGVDFGGGTCAVVADPQGHIRALVDPNSNTVFSASYNDPWGANPEVTDDTPGMYFRYVGQLGVRADLDTGLTYMRQRWYDGALQRFVSRDPIQENSGMGSYVYAIDNPARYIDAAGLDVFVWIVPQTGPSDTGHAFIGVGLPDSVPGDVSIWDLAKTQQFREPSERVSVSRSRSKHASVEAFAGPPVPNDT